MTDTLDSPRGLPHADRGPVLLCVHPDQKQQCHEEAAWCVWYANGLCTYSCHEHLIDRLRDVRLSIVQMRRTPRWEP